MNIAAWLLENAHTLHGNVRGPLRDLFEYREDMPQIILSPLNLSRFLVESSKVLSFLLTEFRLNMQIVQSTALMDWQFDVSGAMVEDHGNTVTELFVADAFVLRGLELILGVEFERSLEAVENDSS